MKDIGYEKKTQKFSHDPSTANNRLEKKEKEEKNKKKGFLMPYVLYLMYQILHERFYFGFYNILY